MNNYIRPMRLSEIRGTPIQGIISRRIFSHTVALFPTDSASLLFDLGSGSGTLATYRRLKGIATTSHVAAQFHNLGYVVVPYAPKEGHKNTWDLKRVPF